MNSNSLSEKLVDKHDDRKEPIDNHATTFMRKKKLAKGSATYIKMKHELKLLESKRTIATYLMDFVGVIILFVSLVYVENECSYDTNIQVQVTALGCVSLLTIIYASLKIISSMYYRSILIATKVLYSNASLFTYRLSFWFLLYLTHPNYWSNAMTHISRACYPSQPFEMKINLYLLMIQVTVISYELLNRLTISAYMSVENAAAVKKHKVSAHSLYFALKYLALEHPFYLLFTYLFMTSVYFSLILKLFESPIDLRENTALFYWSNSLWTIFLNMLTTGYGSGFPVTYMGRVTTVTSGLVGMILFTFFIAAISNVVRLDSGECNTFALIEKNRQKRICKDKAARIITTLLKCYVRYDKENKEQYELVKNRLYDLIVEYKTTKKIVSGLNNLTNIG